MNSDNEKHWAVGEMRYVGDHVTFVDDNNEWCNVNCEGVSNNAWPTKIPNEDRT